MISIYAYMVTGVLLGAWAFTKGPFKPDSIDDIIYGRDARLLGTLFFIVLSTVAWPVFLFVMLKRYVKEQRAYRAQVDKLENEVSHLAESEHASELKRIKNPDGDKWLLVYPSGRNREKYSCISAWHASEELSVGEFLEIGLKNTGTLLPLDEDYLGSSFIPLDAGSSESSLPIDSLFSLFVPEGKVERVGRAFEEWSHSDGREKSAVEAFEAVLAKASEYKDHDNVSMAAPFDFGGLLKIPPIRHDATSLWSA